GIDEATVLATGEAAAAVTAAQRPAHGRRNRPRSDDRGVAGEPARRLGRERAAILEFAATLAVVGKDSLVGMDDHLVALAARTPVALVRQRRVGDRDQRLGVRGLPRGPRFRGTARLLPERVAQRL